MLLTKIVVILHTKSQIMNNIGINIRKLREQRGYSQEVVATELGINQSTYGKIERDASNITVERLQKIAEILDVDMASILDVGTKNTFTNQTNQGNGYVETINNDYRTFADELKSAYEKTISAKDEQIVLLKGLLERK